MTETTEAAAALTITLNGRSVSARPGELIIAAAERAGVFIPRFCYHPRMKPVGMCRMCLVEVSGPRGPSLQPACFVEVADGQEIATSSEAARKAQEGVLEYLLLNHPLDCPVCDKGGECPLQDQSVSHGPGESRFDEEKRHWPKPIKLGPLVLLDRERCIQCARCTRFAEEVAGEPFIDFAERGDRIEVAIFPDEPFASYFAGNTVQICPVGALTSVPYRFRSRPWDLEQVETTCTSCAFGCRMVAQSSAGRLVRYIGVDSEPVNQSWLCDRGRFGYEAVEADDRLASPMVRSEGELVQAGWHEALGTVASALSEALGKRGPAGVGVIGGARLPNEDLYAWVKLVKGVMGSDNFDAQLGDGLPAELVAGLPRATIDDALSAGTVVLLAGDLREDLPVLYLRLRHAAAHRGLRIIDCSPVRGALGRWAEWRPYLPGGAPALARSLARELGDGAGVVVVLGRPSLAEGADQIAAAAAVLAGALPGARFLPALRRANVHGAIDLGAAPGMLPGRVGLEDGREWFASQWATVPAAAGLDTAGMLEAAAAGELDVLVLLGADPLSDFPDRGLAVQALERVGFLVSVDTVANTSSLLADVVLAAAGYAERAGTTTNIEGRVSRLASKVVPPGTARADWIIACELADRLGADLGLESLEQIWSEIEAGVPLYRGCTTRVLAAPAAADGIVVPIPSTTVGLSRRPAPLDPIATPGIEAVEQQGAPLVAGAAAAPGPQTEPGPEPQWDEEAAREGEESGLAAPEATPPEEPRSQAGGDRPEPPATLRLDPARWPEPAGERADGDGGLLLVVRHALYDQGTLVQSAPSLAPLAAPQVLRLGPATLAGLGLPGDEAVRVRSGRGELVVTTVVDGSVPEGVALLGANAAPVDEAGASALVDHRGGVTTVFVEGAR